MAPKSSKFDEKTVLKLQNRKFFFTKSLIFTRLPETRRFCLLKKTKFNPSIRLEMRNYVKQMKRKKKKSVLSEKKKRKSGRNASWNRKNDSVRRRHEKGG